MASIRAMLLPLSTDVAEKAARQDLAVRLYREGVDFVVRIWIERVGEPGRRIEVRNVVA